MTVDLSEFATPHKTKCKLARIIEDLDASQAEKLLSALGEPKIVPAGITRALRGWGIAVSENVVKRHRQGLCCCA